jgi:hypothetical protein
VVALLTIVMTVGGVLTIQAGARLSLPAGGRLIGSLVLGLQDGMNRDADRLGAILFFFVPQLVTLVIGLALNVAGVAAIIIATLIARETTRRRPGSN